MKTKKCSKCHKIKSILKFNRDKSTKDSYIYWCKKCVKKYQEIHKKKIKEYAKKYYQENKKKILKRNKQYNIDHKKERQKYLEDNKEKIKKQNSKCERERRKKDLNFKLRKNLRTRIYMALKSNSKSQKTRELLGCSIKNLKQHLQKQFKSGITWNNYGKWHIDHIKPCVRFDLSKPNEQKKCFHYTNLQPLWSKENIRKGCRITKKEMKNE